MVDANFTPVLIAAGFNEREHAHIVNDGGNAFDAVSVIMADKAITKSEPGLAKMLRDMAHAKHAATEPKESVIAWAEWELKVIKETKPYESFVMAVSCLEPHQRAALRERVMGKLKLSEVVQ
jgi:hypothetical protein